MPTAYLPPVRRQNKKKTITLTIRSELFWLIQSHAALDKKKTMTQFLQPIIQKGLKEHINKVEGNMLIQGKDAHLEFLVGLIETDPEHQLVQAMKKAMAQKMLMPLLAGYLERMATLEKHVMKFGIDHDCIESECFDKAGEITLLFEQYKKLNA